MICLQCKKEMVEGERPEPICSHCKGLKQTFLFDLIMGTSAVATLHGYPVKVVDAVEKWVETKDGKLP